MAAPRGTGGEPIGPEGSYRIRRIHAGWHTSTLYPAPLPHREKRRFFHGAIAIPGVPPRPHGTRQRRVCAGDPTGSRSAVRGAACRGPRRGPRRRLDGDPPPTARDMRPRLAAETGRGRPRRGGLDREQFPRRPTLPPGCPGSTIGAGGLNFRVRNVTGCVPSAKATGDRAPQG